MWFDKVSIAVAGSQRLAMSAGQLAASSCRRKAMSAGIQAFALTVMLFAGYLAMAADLESLQVLPLAGQSAEQARRDRYECHNWAVEETGVQPVSRDAETERAEQRSRRVDKVISGAAIGAAIGGILRGNDSGRSRDVADGALGGAVLGAAAGAIAGQVEADREQPDVADDYLRALAACMTGRSYELRDGEGEVL